MKLILSDDIRRHKKFSIACDIHGNIFSLKTGLKRRLWKTKHGYLQIAVGGTSYLAHRLVADVFIPNPENKPNINHKNGIKDDNSIANLEWCTQRENIIHARDSLGVKYSLPGDQNPHAKVLESHRIIIGNLYRMGFTFAEMSQIMGFAVPTIARHFKRSCDGDRGKERKDRPHQKSKAKS